MKRMFRRIRQPTAALTMAAFAVATSLVTAGCSHADTSTITVRPSGRTFTGPHGAVSDGTHYGYATEVNAAHRSLSFNEVQFFQGQAAMNACRQDSVKPAAEWCNMFYIRNLHHPASMPIASGAAVLDWHGPNGIVVNPDRPITLEQMARIVVSPGGMGYLLRLIVRDGEIIRIEGVYTP
jgi:hypothetical protein